MTLSLPSMRALGPCRSDRGAAVPALATALTALVALLVAAPARGDYGPGAQAASANGTLLGDQASTAPALSADGRYVVFLTSAPALLGRPADDATAYATGLVRRDLVTGAVELVAPPRLVRRSDGAVLRAGVTKAGSIGGDGRHVVFETTEPLAPGDLNQGSDVYERDMTVPGSDVTAYTLVSALDGQSRAPAYADGAGSRTGQLGFGVSDDGRAVVFWTSGSSNLPAGGPVATPGREVFVRRLDTGRTTLVTRDAADPGLQGTPAPRRPDGPAVSPAPVISGDGGAVAWADSDAGAQVPLLAGEPSPPLAYLWRDVGAGAAATTRLASGASDPDDPACAPGSPFVAAPEYGGPCAGPFVVSDAYDDHDGSAPPSTLSISGDGRRLLFLSSAHQRPFDVTAYRPASLYLADMTPGRPRKQAVARVLSVVVANRSIFSAVLARDGCHVALSSTSNAFDGARPIGGFPSGDLTTTNAFVLDLDERTIQRATTGLDGGDYVGAITDSQSGSATTDPGLRQLAIDADATALAFAADDGNLFLGDGNGVTDIQVVHGGPGLGDAAGAASVPLTTSLPAAGSSPTPLPALRPLAPIHPVIGYVAVDDRGVARLVVRVPAAGRVSAVAAAPLAGRRLTVARASRAVRAAGNVALALMPSRAARRALRHRGLRVSVAVRYRPRSGAATTATRRYVLARGGER